MKNIIFILPVLMILSGCTGSNIKVVLGPEVQDTYTMFGKIPSRDFYYPINIGDSLGIKWEAEANGGFTQSSVTFYGSNVFVNDLSGRIFCFDSNTGKIKGQLKHKGAIYTTPSIIGYKLIYIEALNDEDKSLLHIHNFLEGRKVAETEFNGRVQTEILLIGNKVYFVTEKGLLYKFSHVGDMYWVKDLKAMVHTSLTSDGESLYISTDNKELISVNAENGEINYRKNVGAIITSGITLKGEYIFAGDENGFIYSFSKSAGDIKWKYKSAYKVTALPVLNSEFIFVANLGGEILALDIDSGKQEWIITSGGMHNSTPLLTNNYLIVPDLAGKLLFVDIKNGKIEKNIELPNRVKLSPVINGNTLFTGYDRGILRAYEIY